MTALRQALDDAVEMPRLAEVVHKEQDAKAAFLVALGLIGHTSILIAKTWTFRRALTITARRA